MKLNMRSGQVGEFAVKLGVDLQLTCDYMAERFIIRAHDDAGDVLQELAVSAVPPTDAIIGAARATAIQLFPDHVTMTADQREEVRIQRRKERRETEDLLAKLEGDQPDLDDAQRRLITALGIGTPEALKLVPPGPPPLAPHAYERDRSRGGPMGDHDCKYCKLPARNPIHDKTKRTTV